MLGATAICSPIFAVGSPAGFPAPAHSIRIDSSLPASLPAEHLRWMFGRKGTIARLP